MLESATPQSAASAGTAGTTGSKKGGWKPPHSSQRSPPSLGEPRYFRDFPGGDEDSEDDDDNGAAAAGGDTHPSQQKRARGGGGGGTPTQKAGGFDALLAASFQREGGAGAGDHPHAYTPDNSGAHNRTPLHTNDHHGSHHYTRDFHYHNAHHGQQDSAKKMTMAMVATSTPTGIGGGGTTTTAFSSSSAERDAARARAGGPSASCVSSSLLQHHSPSLLLSSSSQSQNHNVTSFTTASYRCSIVPLALAEDKYWLSDLQCYIRQHYVEVFGATEDDLTHTLHGRSKPTFIGQVGIRCQFCKDVHANERGQHHVYYPALISGVYNCVQQMLRMHLDCCSSIPKEVLQRIENLKRSSSSRGGRKQYWIDSAKKLGLSDTSRGILFERDPQKSKKEADASESSSGRNCTITAPLMLTTPNANGSGAAAAAAATTMITTASDLLHPTNVNMEDVMAESAPSMHPEDVASSGGMGMPPDQPSPAAILLMKQQPDTATAGGGGIGGGEGEGEGGALLQFPPLVLERDKHLIAEVLFVTFENMHPVPIVESDQVGCYKSRPLGFIGLACNHCVGQAGCGRYFPANEASLSQTTTSQTLLNHVRKCRGAPAKVRDDLDALMRTKLKKGEKPRHGGRKVFFHRLWCRMQGLKEPQNDEDQLENNMRRIKNKNAQKPPRPTSPGGTPLPPHITMRTDSMEYGGVHQHMGVGGHTSTTGMSMDMSTPTHSGAQAHSSHDTHSHSPSQAQSSATSKRRRSGSVSSKKRPRASTDTGTGTTSSVTAAEAKEAAESDELQPQQGSSNNIHTKDGSQRKLEIGSATTFASSPKNKRAKLILLKKELSNDLDVGGAENENENENGNASDDVGMDDSAAESIGDSSSGLPRKSSLTKDGGSWSDVGGGLLAAKSHNNNKKKKNKKVPSKPKFAGVASLAQPDDPFWLSDLQCFVRSQCVEAFSASEADVAAMAQNLTHFAESWGNNSATGMFLDHKIMEGQIGIRCKFCANAIILRRRRQDDHPFKTSSVAAAVAQASTFATHDDDDDEDDSVNRTAPISPIRNKNSVLTVKTEEHFEIQKNDVNDVNNDSKEKEEEEATDNVEVEVKVDVDVKPIVEPTTTNNQKVQAQEVSLLAGASRDSDHVMFATSIAELKTVVLDMMKFHTASCPNMPAEAKKTFKVLQKLGVLASKEAKAKAQAEAQADAQASAVDAALALLAGSSSITGTAAEKNHNEDDKDKDNDNEGGPHGHESDKMGDDNKDDKHGDPSADASVFAATAASGASSAIANISSASTSTAARAVQKANAQQYWMDAAKETGMVDGLPAQGSVIVWFRDPTQEGGCTKLFRAVDSSGCKTQKNITQPQPPEHTTAPTKTICSPGDEASDKQTALVGEEALDTEISPTADIDGDEKAGIVLVKPDPALSLGLEGTTSASTKDKGEDNGGAMEDMLEGMIIKRRDREISSDQLFFILAQLQPCAYDTNQDRRRGRATIKNEGYPGIECRWCCSKGTGKGRYFPVSAKLFCDGTTPNIHNHLLACEWCPQDVKASIEYLNHRVYDEKARLPLGWRRKFYKLIWNRIHGKPMPKDYQDSDSTDENDIHAIKDTPFGIGGDDDAPLLVSDADGLGDGVSSVDDTIDAAARWLTELSKVKEPVSVSVSNSTSNDKIKKKNKNVWAKTNVADSDISTSSKIKKSKSTNGSTGSSNAKKKKIKNKSAATKKDGKNIKMKQLTPSKVAADLAASTRGSMKLTLKRAAPTASPAGKMNAIGGGVVESSSSPLVVAKRLKTSSSDTPTSPSSLSPATHGKDAQAESGASNVAKASKSITVSAGKKKKKKKKKTSPADPSIGEGKKNKKIKTKKKRPLSKSLPTLSASTNASAKQEAPPQITSDSDTAAPLVADPFACAASAVTEAKGNEPMADEAASFNTESAKDKALLVVATIVLEPPSTAAAEDSIEW
jgi:hypothetical protein